MTPVATLYVERFGASVRVRLELPERDAAEPLQQEVSVGLDEHTLAELRRAAAGILGMADSAGFEREALTRGQVLYRSLIPRGMQAALEEVTQLLVSTSLHGVPWELLHDGKDFWGLRYALGRRLVTERPPAAARFRPLRGRPRALVVASDPRGDLPFVGTEAEAIASLLADLVEVRLVAGPIATFATVTSYLREGFDLIHFCGHVVPGSDGGSALLLAGEDKLATAVIERNVQGRPLVFLNGCASSGPAARDANGWDAELSSVASAFLFGGAIGVVGTLADIGDASSADLAQSFYLRILESFSIGEALRLARADVRAARPQSPAWLAFVLYGNPSHVLVEGALPSQPALPPPPPAAPDPARRARVGRRAVLAASGAAAALAAVAALGRWPLLSRPVPAEPRPIVVGVMGVRDPQGNVPPWMLEVTRDGLNTIFSKVGRLRLYSKQKIDFLRVKRGLSEIEVADALGMTMMISTTLAVADSSVQIDIEIVDIGNGLLVGSESVRGSVDKLVELQNQVALETLAALDVLPTGDELDQILAYRTNETLAGYKLLAETLPGAAPLPPSDAAPAPGRTAPGHSWLFSPPSAAAAEADGDQAVIRALLQQYQEALRAKSLDRLAALQVGMEEVQKQALARYFENANGLDVKIAEVDLLVEGDDALATFTRRDTFTDLPSGRPVRLEVRIEQRLVRTDNGWRILATTDAK